MTIAEYELDSILAVISSAREALFLGCAKAGFHMITAIAEKKVQRL